MANVYKNIKVDLTSTDTTTVYTVPSETTALIRSIRVSNDDTSNACTLTLTLTNTSSAVFSLEKDKIRQIHTDRKACWENTAMVQNLVRSKIAKGEKYETPYYIEVVKEELKKVGDMFSFPSEKAIVKSMTKPNDQN